MDKKERCWSFHVTTGAGGGVGCCCLPYTILDTNKQTEPQHPRQQDAGGARKTFRSFGIDPRWTPSQAILRGHSRKWCVSRGGCKPSGRFSRQNVFKESQGRTSV
ncbi:hypothetical protein SK128_023362 [Halocaridina rubra]|uniref:Uncharacterized protein n=1 Tax=Halocaridina rubra TaxID=373956 RepID=A0AAN8X2W2_HALRR